MRKIIFTLFALTGLIFANILPAQNPDSWILPFSDKNVMNDFKTYRFEFAENIQPVLINGSNEDPNYRFSAGGYDDNGNLLFYILGYKLFDNNNSFIGNYSIILTRWSSDGAPEVQIIRKPGNTGNNENYYIIWALKSSGGNTDKGYYYTRIFTIKITRI